MSLTSGKNDDICLEEAPILEPDTLLLESIHFLALLELDPAIDDELRRSDINVVALLL
jgi:hypothetical protein